jgi:hypothetical protein
VSTYAQDKILDHLNHFDQLKAEGKAIPVCTGSFSRVWGLPCMHISSVHRILDTPIKFGNIDEQWHLDDVAPVVGDEVQVQVSPPVERPLVQEAHALLTTTCAGLTDGELIVFLTKLKEIAAGPHLTLHEPKKVTKCGRPSSSINKNGRVLSAFKEVQLAVSHMNQTCGMCHQPGHAAKNCPQPR